MRILLATFVASIALAFASAAASAQTPAPVTGPAQPVGTNTATLTGTVDADGATGVQWQFQYGTTTAYGNQTAVQNAPAGSGPQAVSAPIAGLTASTTYHFRLVAIAGGVEQYGADGTFTTLASPSNPAPPAISRLSAKSKTASSALLTARIDPNRAATTYHMEWGTSTRLGNSTPDATLPVGDGPVAVSAPIAGLAANTRIYWRVVASNAAGLRRSGQANFTTQRSPSGVTLSVSPDVVPWGGTVSLSGTVAGTGVTGMSVALQASSFPYTAGFTPVATARVNGDGGFRFDAQRPLLATRYQAVAGTTAPVVSGQVEALVRAIVGIRGTARKRRTLVLAGRVSPGLPEGRATLQRRSRGGGWSFVRRRALRTPDSSVSRYRFKVWRKRRNVAYRVKVTANDGGAHLGAASRTVVVAKKPRARR
jgi:hypothetical protein